MKTNQFFGKAIVWLILALTLVACESEPQTGSRRRSRSRGGVKEQIDKDTDSLSKVTDWASAQKLYAQLKTDIERHVKDERVKDDMYSLLDKAYCHSMDTIMYGILTANTCNNNHILLREIHFTRVKAFASIETNIHNEVEQKFKTHEDMVNFIRKTKDYKQPVNSYTSSYDESYEKTQKATASSYLKQDVICSEIKKGLQSITDGSAFYDCHKAFCDKVVELYINGGVYDADVHKRLLLKIKAFHEFFREADGKPLTKDAERWKKALDDFKTEHTNTI